jgi:ubiquinone/menaquinone biosynthesis C-methylase UbiE
MTTSGIRPEAQVGFSAAAEYDAGRPTYLPEPVEQLLERLQIAGVKGARILEIAAGTGKLTEVLAARPEQFDIVAVEPHDDMRQQLSKKMLPRVSVVKGTAENLKGAEDGAFAAVIAAQVGRSSW